MTRGDWQVPRSASRPHRWPSPCWHRTLGWPGSWTGCNSKQWYHSLHQVTCQLQAWAVMTLHFQRSNVFQLSAVLFIFTIIQKPKPLNLESYQEPNKCITYSLSLRFPQNIHSEAENCFAETDTEKTSTIAPGSASIIFWPKSVSLFTTLCLFSLNMSCCH